MKKQKAQKAERRAYALVKKLRLKRPPVPVEKVAEQLGVAIRPEPFEDELSGMLVKERGRYVIGVNSSHSVTRQRFSIAHELGHFILKHPGELFVGQTLQHRTVIRRDGKSALGVDPVEIEANAFAAALLMPEKLVAEQIEKRLESKTYRQVVELISELANTFQVSTQAMEYRLTNLGYVIPR